ncbi:MAG: helix-turn-helix transcriptional regulator [Oscillospiraceae bacterium]
MYLTIRQAAEHLQVSTKTIYRRIKDGSLQAIKLGSRTVRIDEQELERYINQFRGKREGEKVICLYAAA